MVIAANRDESYARPWDPPALYRHLGICRPTDRIAGGTWIGVNRFGLAVAVTNRRPKPVVLNRRSRGLLCADILATSSVGEACATLRRALAAEPYNNFNMLIASATEARVLHHEASETRLFPLADGVHILSNFHDLDDPAWTQTRARLSESAAQGWPALQTHLHQQLASHDPAPDGHLTCKHGDHYGTLCAGIIRLQPRTTPDFQFAPGPPCTTPFAPTPRFT